MTKIMDYNEPIVVSNYNNCVKVEPDEVVLYGCHFCQDLAFEDYEELKKHLEDHLEKEDKDDGIQVKKEFDEVQGSYDLTSEDDSADASYVPTSDEDSEDGHLISESTSQNNYPSSSGTAFKTMPRGVPAMIILDKKGNPQFSSQRKLMSSVRHIEGEEDDLDELKAGRENQEIAVAEDKEFECEFCSKKFERKHSLVIHLRVHTGERPYTCKECGASYKQSGDLKVHMHTHVGLKPFSCEICHATFLRRGDVNRHMVIHSKEKPFKCEACGRNFSRSYQLKLHWQNKHAENGTWKGEDVRTGEMVKGKVEKPEKRYECATCNKTFKDMRNLRVHIRLHTGYKPYKCEVCEKTFAHSGSFNIHKRIHTGEKPYACGICNERFNCSSAVGKHHRRAHANPSTND